MKWSPHVDCDELTHSLAHLHPSEFVFALRPTVRRPKAIDATVRVTYGLHCFTRAPKSDEAVVACQIYCKNKEGRLFCQDRYSLAKELPGIVGTILDRNCFLTDKKNRVLFSSAHTSDGEQYAVFFVLSRAAEQAPHDANLYIISAHKRMGFKSHGKPDKFRDLLRLLI